MVDQLLESDAPFHLMAIYSEWNDKHPNAPSGAAGVDFLYGEQLVESNTGPEHRIGSEGECGLLLVIPFIRQVTPSGLILVLEDRVKRWLKGNISVVGELIGCPDYYLTTSAIPQCHSELTLIYDARACRSRIGSRVN